MGEERGEATTLGVGIDESNHGRDNEIFAAAISRNFNDVIPFNFQEKARTREAKSRILRILRRAGRDYTFLCLPEEIKEMMPKEKRIGIVIASLLQDIEVTELDNLELYLDGEWPRKQLVYARDYFSKLISLDRNRISINCGARLDTYIPLVYYADGLASFLFRQKTPEYLSTNSHRRKLLLPKELKV
jgi:hypothetical protein